MLCFVPVLRGCVSERRDMGLYEVTLSMSLLGFGMGKYVSQPPYVSYYVGVKSSFKQAREECESNMSYMV